MSIQGSQRTALDSYLASIRGTELLSDQQERDLARKGQLGDIESLNELVSRNLCFVVKIAKEYRHHAVPFEDLLNAGNLGLIRAAERFDSERGNRFITYAIWWIRKCLIEVVSEHVSMMRIPRHHLQRTKLVRETEKRLRSELGRDPRTDEISEQLAFTVTPNDHLLMTRVRWISIDEPARKGDEATPPFKDRLPCPSTVSPETRLLNGESSDRLARALSSLPSRERIVITHRFGLRGATVLTLREIGELVGLSRERVRQLESSALRRLRRLLRK